MLAKELVGSRSGLSLPRGERYTRVAIVLHWTIAALIIFNLIIGFFNWGFGWDVTHAPGRGWLYRLLITSHISAGMTVLLLTVVRIGWRLVHEPPPHAAGLKRWERNLSHFTHFLLYAAMLLVPLTGWAVISANPPDGSAGQKARVEMMARNADAQALAPKLPGAQATPPPPPRIWWAFPMPEIAPIANIGREPDGLKAQGVLHGEFADWHEIGAWLTIFLLLLHVAGALKHQIFDRQPSLSRMGIGRDPEPGTDRAEV